jgi:hypothetical protein
METHTPRYKCHNFFCYMQVYKKWGLTAFAVEEVTHMRLLLKCVSGQSLEGQFERQLTNSRICSSRHSSEARTRHGCSRIT